MIQLFLSYEKRWWLWPCAYKRRVYWGCVENLRREQRGSERKGQRKEHKQSRVIGREHPQGHRRGACRVQHTHMPAYCIRHLEVWRWNRVTHTADERVGPTSDFSILFWASTCVMISFMLVSRTIPPITISARMLWTFGNARHFKIREQVFLLNKGKSEVTELITTVTKFGRFTALFMLLPQTCAIQPYDISYTVAWRAASIEM